MVEHPGPATRAPPVRTRRRLTPASQHRRRPQRRSWPRRWDLTLAQLAKLGSILALELVELLDDQDASSPCTPAGRGNGDIATVGSLLADVKVLVPVEALADALDWDLTRVLAALDGLDTTLRPAGLRVHRLHHDVRIARTVTTVDPQTLKALWHIHFARRSLTITQARLLRQIRDGDVRLASNMETQKVRLPELSNAGLIVAASAEIGSTAKWELTPDVRYSLMLDEMPTTRDEAAPANPIPAHRLTPARP
ncbi:MULTISPECIES: hypothetical protein [Arsenicicoccus]|uniref:hypothetical protein n=1 Tax=Arsenicicoccus TaxID=267408 RepID=UPI00257BB663|nr:MULTISPECIES: hypothetical protein [Arsenicicoccus]